MWLQGQPARTHDGEPHGNRTAVADYRQIIDALARRDQVRMLVDGLTAANDLGLTTPMPSRLLSTQTRADERSKWTT